MESQLIIFLYLKNALACKKIKRAYIPTCIMQIYNNICRMYIMWYVDNRKKIIIMLCDCTIRQFFVYFHMLNAVLASFKKRSKFNHVHFTI